MSTLRGACNWQLGGVAESVHGGTCAGAYRDLYYLLFSSSRSSSRRAAICRFAGDLQSNCNLKLSNAELTSASMMLSAFLSSSTKVASCVCSCVCMCACVCARACVCLCVRARACVYVYVCVSCLCLLWQIHVCECARPYTLVQCMHVQECTVSCPRAGRHVRVCACVRVCVCVCLTPPRSAYSAA